MAEEGSDDIHRAARLGPPAPFTCPECGGTLWEHQEGEMLQYHCHVGHRFSGDSLAVAESEELDQALWTALRALEENSALWKRMAARSRQRGMEAIAADYDEKGDESHRRAQVVRRVLLADRAELTERGAAVVSGPATSAE